MRVTSSDVPVRVRLPPQPLAQRPPQPAAVSLRPDVGSPVGGGASPMGSGASPAGSAASGISGAGPSPVSRSAPAVPAPAVASPGPTAPSALARERMAGGQQPLAMPGQSANDRLSTGGP